MPLQRNIFCRNTSEYPATLIHERAITLHTSIAYHSKYNGISARYIRQSLFETQVSRTIPGYVTARYLCWCHCPCLWGARWFSWTSSWSVVELWDNPQYYWPQYNSPTVWGLRSSLQLPGLSLHWGAMLSSVVMPPAIQHLPWPGSKPQPTQVDDQGCCLVSVQISVNQTIHDLICFFVQTVAKKPLPMAPSSCPGFWTVVSDVSHI